jgi:hypothetical protein
VPRPIDSVQPPLEFIPPNLDHNVLRFMRSTLPLWMRFKTSIGRIDANNVEHLAELYQQFQAGKIRILLAFRHPSTDDPTSMMYLMHYLLPQVAKQSGIRLKAPTHAHFMYDRGIPLWAGAKVGWLYSKLGGTPIHRGKLDRVGLKSARDLLANGKFPLMAAPEGATNGHNEVVSPLEPGISQLGFWCVEDLVKANRSEKVIIVPVGIQYRYMTPPWQKISNLLSALEEDAFGKSNAANDVDEKHLYRRLYKLSTYLLTLMEGFYARFYHQKLDIPEHSSDEIITNEEFSYRLTNLLNVALRVAEQYFNLLPKGTVIDRCRRLEQAAWDCIYRDDVQIEKLSPIERGLADRVAEEANLRIWHMRIVESFVAVTGKYVFEKPTVDRFAEGALILWDVMTRIKGGNPFNRPILGKQSATVTLGQSICLSDRWEIYSRDRRSAKQAVADLTKELQIAMESMIQP